MDMKRTQFSFLYYPGIIGCLVLFITTSCQDIQTDSKEPQSPNILSTLTAQDLGGFHWMNAPDSFVLQHGSLKIHARQGTDFFNNPENLEVTASAPLLFKEMSGDFVATTLVQPNFQDMWNAGALMVYIDSLHWIKFAFENSDATGKSIVSVVTKGSSDDANGVRLSDHESIWLRIIKKENLYALHWSEDGRNYKMARLSTLPEAPKVKVGLEAQCPVGKAATHEFLYYSIEEMTVENLRTG